MKSKILVVSSCTKKKKKFHLNQPKCSELKTKESKAFFIKKYPKYTCKAREMYSGYQHKCIYNAITLLREIAYVDFYILSAGFGLIEENELLPAYDCTFSNKNNHYILARSIKLNIPEDFNKLVNKTYDLIYLALGRSYLESLGNWVKSINNLTIAFYPIKNPKILSIQANSKAVNIMSKFNYHINGVIGFKGDLLRILTDVFLKLKEQNIDYNKVIKDKESLNAFLINHIFFKSPKFLFY